MKDKKKQKLLLILRMLMVLCILGILYSALILFLDNQEYCHGKDTYEKVRLAKIPSQPVLNEEIEQSNDPLESIDFSALKEMNQDVVGWIRAEGEEIDYPVVKGTDNDYYLRHLFTGESNKLGTIFMDYRNTGDYTDGNTIIYGHNMENGSMFASILKYKDQSYYEKVPSMSLYTLHETYQIEFFAGIVVDGNYESIPFNFKDSDDFQGYINMIKENSTFESKTVVEAEDKLVTLCTCSYEFDNARYALFGKLTLVE